MIAGREPRWRWPEERWCARHMDWRAGEIVSAGVDVGSVSSQAVVMVDGALYAWSSRRTGASSAGSAEAAMAWALEGTGMSLADIHYVVGTGYGRVNVPFAHKAISEIHCHARGGHFAYGERVRTILDVGGQDLKAIRCDERGKVVAFLLNDKCAAGTGRGLEVFADLVDVPIDRIGPISFDVAEEPPPVPGLCVVFARTEAAAMLRQGRARELVLAAYCRATARRIADLALRLGVEPELGITGGVAKNPGVVRRLEHELGCTTLTSDLDPQIAGALGAALFGHARALKERGKRRESRASP